MPKPIEVERKYAFLAYGYDQHYQTPDVATENRLMRQFFGRGNHGKCLDLGCGTACAVEILELDEASYLGVDISPKMLRVARDKHPALTLVACDCRALWWAREKGFDTAVSLFSLFDYCEKSEAPSLIEQIARLTVRQILIAVPGPAYCDRVTYTSEVDPKPNEWTPAEIRESIAASGIACDAMISGINSQDFTEPDAADYLLIRISLPTSNSQKG